MQECGLYRSIFLLPGNCGVSSSAAVSVSELSSTFHYQKSSLRVKTESFITEC